MSDKITPELIAQHGLTTDEYKRIVDALGREPNYTELGVFSVMWSEHCSYKSSRIWLGKLHTTGKQVIQGPGENAGVVDIGDGQAVIFKMESHNHPSFIEPYQGAATGVGGIMRDVFTMGARPIANLNALRFGDIDHAKTRHLVSGVVAGIGGYGNCMGVPTVGGEVNFDASYNGNILVNAMCVGLAEADNIFYAAASGLGNPVIYVGSKTGRDGIHGATMASTEFDDDSDEKRPTVQVGDPFAEKLLLEACLELMSSDAIIAIQDMGAAGLTSSSVEMADKGNVGFELDLDQVPQREENMTPYEMLLSESQERMLMVLKPGREEEARRIFEKWELDFAVVGKTTDTNRLVVTHKGEMVADMPLHALAHDAPVYERPWVATKPAAKLTPGEVPAPDDVSEALLKIIAAPDMASKRWIWEQYDHMVMGDTVQRPGGDAAVVRVHGSGKGIAMSVDVTPRYCRADPFEGGKQAIAEGYRNLTASGAQPLATTDCMNFGSPERPEIMGQFVGAIKGIAEACKALDFPIISGNVSFYNETKGEAILPTPAIGSVGLIPDIRHMMTLSLKDEGDVLILIGAENGHLGQSIYLRDILGRDDGPPPPVNLAAEKLNGGFIRALIWQGKINAAHDLSDGGLYIAIAEMAMAGNIGANIKLAGNSLPDHAALFGEDQARYLIAVPPGGASEILIAARKAGVPARLAGTVGGKSLTVDERLPISIARLKTAHEKWMPEFMAGEL